MTKWKTKLKTRQQKRKKHIKKGFPEEIQTIVIYQSKVLSVTWPTKEKTGACQQSNFVCPNNMFSEDYILIINHFKGDNNSNIEKHPHKEAHSHTIL